MHLLIVDDEKNIRDSLKDFVPWIDLGIKSVKTAKNGIDALLKAEVQKPDLLLTDVRMPKMDGINLAESIKKLYPFCKIVFLSGYADKEYLKSAINLNAVNYIEKPIDIEEIKEVVNKAVKIFKEEESRRLESKKLKICLNDSMPCIRQDIALHMIRTDCTVAQMEEKLSNYSIKISEEGWYTAIYVKMNWPAGISDKNKHGIKEYLINQLNEGFFESYTLSAFDDNSNLVVICGFALTNSSGCSSFVSLLKKLLLGIDVSLCSFSVGIGIPVHSLEDIPSSLCDAENASKMQFYAGINKILFFNSIRTNPFDSDRNIYEDFRKALKKNNINKACKLIDTLTENGLQSRDININHVKNIYFNLLLIFFEDAREIGLIDSIGTNERGYVWKEIDSIVTIEDLSRYLESNIKEIFQSHQDRNSFNYRIREIINYIEENYNDNELTIQSISASVYLSQTYLCAFFKKSTGKTLNQYITDVRIEKAKKLLSNNSVKVYEIAYKVGFTDTNYFSTLFKRHVGCTPSEFKERSI